MYTLGINAFTHDASAVLLKNDKIVAYAQEERFSRKKHDASFPFASIEYCLKTAHISYKDINIAAFSWKPFLKIFPRFIKTFYNIKGGFPRIKTQSNKWFDIISVKQLLRKLGFAGKFYYIPHHDAHAAACYYSSNFDDSAILVIDGVGEHATTSFYHGINNSIKLIKQYYYPNSLGLFYAAITEYLGFKNNDGEGKVMGMASYGRPIYYHKMKKCISLINNDYIINKKYFDFANKWYTKLFEKEFGSHRSENEPIENIHFDIAASAQKILEHSIWSLCKQIKKLTESDNLCYTGGVSLNCQANYFIYSKKDFNKYYFFPSAYDAGTSLGAALCAYKKFLNKEINLSFEHVFWGPEIKEDKAAELAKANSLKVRETNEVYTEIASEIANGKIVGWCQGRIEVGPRALGNRSILADSRNPLSKNSVNSKIKKREPFRPFAPTILADKTHLFFDTTDQSPYMMITLPVKLDKKNLIPAVIHVDNTCRLQTLTKEFNQNFYKLIYEFYKLTNIPILLNTSFNKAGEPMIQNEYDAINSFISSDLDILTIGNLIITK